MRKRNHRAWQAAGSRGGFDILYSANIVYPTDLSGLTANSDNTNSQQPTAAANSLPSFARVLTPYLRKATFEGPPALAASSPSPPASVFAKMARAAAVCLALVALALLSGSAQASRQLLQTNNCAKIPGCSACYGAHAPAVMPPTTTTLDIQPSPPACLCLA